MKSKNQIIYSNLLELVQGNYKSTNDQKIQIINNNSREIFIESLPGLFPDSFQLEWLTDRLAED
jgi:hypothetical protein